MLHRPLSTSDKPGAEHHSKGTQNEYTERSNPLLALLVGRN